MAVEADVERLFAEVRDLAKSERKRLAVLVNNAVQYVFGHVTEVTEEDWDRVLGTNVKGCVPCRVPCSRGSRVADEEGALRVEGRCAVRCAVREHCICRRLRYCRA